MTSSAQDRKKVSVPDLARMKALAERVTMITAYDATFARLVDLAGVDIILARPLRRASVTAALSSADPAEGVACAS